MKMNVEIELRVPSFMVKAEYDTQKRIDNALIRFRRVIEVPEFPKAGSQITFDIGEERGMVSTVERSDWSESKQMFVVACQYPNRRITPEQFEALVNDPHWEKTELQA